MFTVKICGMGCREDIAMCADAGADALGFIFADGPTRIALDEAQQLSAQVPSGIARVGIFVRSSADFVREAVRRSQLDVLQFCGGETPEFCGSFDRPTIRVVGVPRQGDPAIAAPRREGLKRARACALLIDSWVAGRAGGTGLPVDLHRASQLAARSVLPVVLAGGLTPLNVSAAIAAVRPAAVDVRSGVERNGKKDRMLVWEFVRAARTALGSVAR